MDDTAGVLLVRRVRGWAEKLAQRPRNSAVNLTEDELARAYRGIDGRPWPEELPTQIPHPPGLASIENWPELVSLAMKASGAGKIYDTVILAESSSPIPDHPSAEFLGYDFGYYDDEFSVFSSIFHEAIHSPVAELRRYASRLNDSLLFENDVDVTAYAKERQSLLERGIDVEAGDCYPIAVFGRRS